MRTKCAFLILLRLFLRLFRSFFFWGSNALKVSFCGSSFCVFLVPQLPSNSFIQVTGCGSCLVRLAQQHGEWHNFRLKARQRVIGSRNLEGPWYGFGYEEPRRKSSVSDLKHLKCQFSYLLSSPWYPLSRGNASHRN